MNSTFKFPDEMENEESTGSEVEIEIEDDTPVEDRNREPMPKEIVEDLEKDELEDYDEKVKEKLKQLKKVWNDERREKEAALREHNEAVLFARRLAEENKQLKHMYVSDGKEYVQTVQQSAELKVKMAEKAYKEAYESGDTDQVIEAQRMLQEANFHAMQARNFKAPSLQEEKFEVQTRPEQVQRAVPKPDDRALAWQKRNEWFGADEEMTATALGLHEKLKRNGVHVGSDDYYAALDKTMRKRFPENFGETEEVAPSAENQRKRPSTVVAPAMRSSASNKIKLKTSQVQLAKKLGLTPEQYAVEMKKLEK